MDKTVKAYMEDYERAMYYIETILEEQDTEELKDLEKEIGVDVDLTSISRLALTSYIWQRVFIIEKGLLGDYIDITHSRIWKNGRDDFDIEEMARRM